jgi:hypothetical protein
MKTIEKIKIKIQIKKITKKFRKEDNAHLRRIPKKPVIIGNPAIDGDFELCRQDQAYREAREKYYEWYDAAYKNFSEELQKLSDAEKLLD